MKNYLLIFVLLISIYSFAQNDWIKENLTAYSIKHPDSWIVNPSENPGEIGMSGPTPDEFKNSTDRLGTSLFVSSGPSKHATIELAVKAYKQKLSGVAFLKNTTILKEEKIKFHGVDAVEIVLTANIQQYSTACRIILFQSNNIYYELSVTYDQKLDKKLVDEAYKVIESFEFVK